MCPVLMEGDEMLALLPEWISVKDITLDYSIAYAYTLLSLPTERRI